MKCRRCGKIFRQDTSKGYTVHSERICQDCWLINYESEVDGV
jgi:uncharacterized C2H2 Zn-finger protein